MGDRASYKRAPCKRAHCNGTRASCCRAEAKTLVLDLGEQRKMSAYTLAGFLVVMACGL